MSNRIDTPSGGSAEHSPSIPTPAKDQSGKPVDVVRKDIAREHSNTEGVDKVITPTSTKEKEQDAETLRAKNRELERKLNGQD
ncbi:MULTISPECIES: hypothetical protein [Pseudomonas syringae group]|uniref:Uncharacterized protein n=3 Tax=Pseudomonas syringae group TaxID=136849 RepID=A0AB37QQL4_9PSED|nr:MULTISPECIES: hypothetical protein [Pseudomonas syringae group]KGS12611.1 hypothetical protein OA77_20935 [Pseudomonas coronafaciens]KOP52264.1 hypothetical protein OX90_24870 [Pseudomonas coronafaciens pv. porri]KOP56953.1 hypothetical protein OX88_07180 [Pseudomonas coronafaciens pv. porri]KPB49437.1 Uncharacterized protein AC511_1843 [Pseudomonas coronafaciens pv. oryzae]KPX30138.1 Uncharacterized protein ALO77_02689 [Pseudomonas coronafaciens pv. garcae]